MYMQVLYVIVTGRILQWEDGLEAWQNTASVIISVSIRIVNTLNVYLIWLQSNFEYIET